MAINPIKRIKMLLMDLNHEIETINLENEIELTLKDKIDASQREYLLREKIRIIKEELGEFHQGMEIMLKPHSVNIIQVGVK